MTRLLEQQDTRSPFTCGEPSLDAYFRSHAWANHQVGISRCYVLTASTPESEIGVSIVEDRARDVRGFYTLSATVVESSAVAPMIEDLIARLPRYPLPAVLIGRFAVAKALQGKGLGRHLLRDALVRSLEISDRLGALGVHLDALDLRAQDFYAAHAFTALRDGGWPRPMFLPMATIRSALE